MYDGNINRVLDTLIKLIPSNALLLSIINLS